MGACEGIERGLLYLPYPVQYLPPGGIETGGEARAAAWASVMGVEWRWIPGSSFAGTGTWERSGSKAKEVRFRELLFADDTTIVGTKEEMDGGVNAMKEVMGRFEERSNDQKEECLDFCMEESESIRVLGSWVGMKEDVNMRLRRAGGLWAKVKEQLKKGCLKGGKRGLCKRVWRVRCCLTAKRECGERRM